MNLMRRSLMATAPPVIKEEMADWVAIGGTNLGIAADNYENHPSGFHRAANEVPSTDYSRRRDVNGAFGPYVDWSYACAGDFAHNNDDKLRTYHVDVLSRLMHGEMPMICEFIGKPWKDKPVLYWARWNGVKNLKKYTGKGHSSWSHISWYRSRVDERAYLWRPQNTKPNDNNDESNWMARIVMNLPTITQGDRGIAVRRLQGLLVAIGRKDIKIDGEFGPITLRAVKHTQRMYAITVDGIVGKVTWSKLLGA